MGAEPGRAGGVEPDLKVARVQQYLTQELTGFNNKAEDFEKLLELANQLQKL